MCSSDLSFDIAELWKKFPFIPQWRRDDIMVSYAPKGGSVGKHFDFYDVFLVQGHGTILVDNLVHVVKTFGRFVVSCAFYCEWVGKKRWTSYV